ncbi:YbhB/YbcL family Raf kinase inhibitor-like protein [Actinoplanes sp. NPDC051411]|uniref:YbhB/YbcL family Raf kinase inhibitor-like protein n=1 Tax=Actinoplanes sp. NPDC051411 TaxID=3155522 RepID=UPI00342C745C
MRRLALFSCVLLLAGCSKSPAPPSAPSGGNLTVTSSDFTDGSAIPSAFTCTGGGHRPTLAWSGVSAPAWAIVVDDPDAPGGDFYHWVVADLPGSAATVGDSVPAGAHELRNSGGSTGWTPPCPPSGTHHYRFTVYALKGRTGIPADSSIDDAFAKISSSASAQGRLTGLVTHTG